MNRSATLAILFVGIISATVHARGFGGGRIGGGGFGGDLPSGPGDFYGNGAYGTGGLPWFVGLPGAQSAYGGFFSGPPQSNLSSKSPGAYHPLAGEQAISAPQYNDLARRQEFVSSLSGMGIQTGGFRPGQFGPPPKMSQDSDAGLPSDMGLHQAGNKQPYGNAGASSVTGAAADQGDGPRYWSTADLRVEANNTRSNFRDYEIFSRNWFTQYPDAWYTRGYARDVWAGADWSEVNAWLGGGLPSYDYTYGIELTYDNDNVCVDGRPIATAAKYFDSAAAIVQAGERANIPRESAASNRPAPMSATWLPLGVFQAIPTGTTSSPRLLQLAINKAGIIRGNYFDPPAKNLQLIVGSVNKDTERAAWIVADRKNIIFDCVLLNLTKSETPILVHVGKDKPEQWLLVRLNQPAGETK